MQRTTDPSAPIVHGRRIYWLISAEWLAHYADEWVFELPAWCTRHFAPLPESFWIPVMTVVTATMILLGWAASRPTAGSSIRLLCAGVQMVFFANAIFHLITTFVFGEYSPGTGSGVLILILSPLLWRAAAREPGVTTSSFATALTAGFVVHGLILLNLLVDKSAWAA